MAWDFSSGQMVANTRVSGRITKCTVTEFTLRQMETVMKETFNRIKSRVMVSTFFIKIKQNTVVILKMIGKTVSELIL